MKMHLADLSMIVEDFSIIIRRDSDFENVFYDIDRELDPYELSLIAVFVADDLPGESEELLHIQGRGHVTLGSTSFEYAHFRFPPGEVTFSYRQISDTQGEITFFCTDMKDMALVRQDYFIISSSNKLAVRIGDKVTQFEMARHDEFYICEFILTAERTSANGETSTIISDGQKLVSRWQATPSLSNMEGGVITGGIR